MEVLRLNVNPRATFPSRALTHPVLCAEPAISPNDDLPPLCCKQSPVTKPEAISLCWFSGPSLDLGSSLGPVLSKMKLWKPPSPRTESS
jgi:hypothetical protein